MLGVGNSDGTVQLWDVASSKLIRSMGGHTDRVRAEEKFNYVHSVMFLSLCLVTEILLGGLPGLEPAPTSQRWEGGGDIAA